MQISHNQHKILNKGKKVLQKNVRLIATQAKKIDGITQRRPLTSSIADF
jgi:hypothetical protein